MSEQPMEQIPNQYVLDELQNQLNTKTSELVIALARIRTRDETIARMQRELDAERMKAETIERAYDRVTGYPEGSVVP